MSKELDELRHSVAHLLAAAVMELYPNTKRTIGPAIEKFNYAATVIELLILAYMSSGKLDKDRRDSLGQFRQSMLWRMANLLHVSPTQGRS